ncbi:hypothetical protein JOC78_000880 [Bacillus ectoiniformans]|uniref:cytochrome c oxidase subunit 2A n=1 Tax=Bacillus ectoiniformans TaxID=1494429 RepID=UPI00195F119A|nr:cytochrome c oxidase subunit 2A [Bacillus ectoiniformans]MBM7647940.1 hypothetical protein [Bacillus ectoiniformans]
MANLQTKESQETEIKVNQEDPESLKGTLYSVFGLGLFLVITWFGVFALFLGRF